MNLLLHVLAAFVVHRRLSRRLHPVRRWSSGKLFYGVDVRKHGSGNVGTTNVFRVLGKRAGVAVLICDMLKGFVPAFIAAQLFHPWFVIFIAAAPVVGHMYSIFLKGSGGKGVATGAAVVLALVPAWPSCRAWSSGSLLVSSRAT